MPQLETLSFHTTKKAAIKKRALSLSPLQEPRAVALPAGFILTMAGDAMRSAATWRSTGGLLVTAAGVPLGSNT